MYNNQFNHYHQVNICIIITQIYLFICIYYYTDKSPKKVQLFEFFNFLLLGQFYQMNQSEMKEKIEQHGGKVLNSSEYKTTSVHYAIIGKGIRGTEAKYKHIKNKKDIKCVKQDWIQHSIDQNKAISIEQYKISVNEMVTNKSKKTNKSNKRRKSKLQIIYK